MLPLNCNDDALWDGICLYKVTICAASALALLQRTISLAVLASIGGYLAPILLSTGGGSHVVLFSYYLMLSIGILVISVWQAWDL